MLQNLIAILLLGAVTVSASAGTGSAQDAASRNDVITTDGISGITVGMTRRQVSGLINPRGGYEKGEFAGNPYLHNYYETRNGLATVEIERGYVTAVQTTSPRFSTPAGARVGMSETALRRMYGNRLRRVGQPELGFAYILLSSNGNGLHFGVDDRKVWMIEAGRRNSIDGMHD